MIRKVHAGVLALAVIGVFGTENVAHTAPRARLEHPDPKKRTGFIKLKTGEQIDAKRYHDELNKLQEALESDGVSMKKSEHRPPPARIPFSKTADAEKAQARSVLQQKIQLLQGIEAKGFAPLVQKRGTAASSVMAPHAAQMAGAATAVAQLPAGPMAVGYEETLGKKDRAAIYVSLNLKDSGDKESVGCDASLDGGIYLFNHQQSLLKVAATGKAKSNSLSGEIDLYVAGQAVSGFPKKGSSSGLNWNKSYHPPALGTKIYWGPLSIDIEGSVAGEFKLVASNTQDGEASAKQAGAKGVAAQHLGAATSLSGGGAVDNTTTIGHCGLTATPSVHASAEAKAMLDVVAFRAGLKGTIVLMDVKSPLSASIALKKEPLQLREDFKADLDAQFLDGKIDLIVESRLPDDWEVWDVDWKTVYTKNLFDWDGLSLHQKLANVSGKQEIL